MKTTVRTRLAVLATLSLACVVALGPAAPATPAAPDPEPARGEERPAPQSIFAGTGIGLVLEANGNEVPKNGAEMMKALAKIGSFAQLPVTFSAVDLKTGLSRPRVIITPVPSMLGLAPNGRPDPREPRTPGGVPALAPVSRTSVTKPNLEGRLYLAANMEHADGQLKVKTFEFISWNGRKQRFDFGFIECDEVEPQIRVVDGVKCFSCHKNKGPILGQGPWSNTTHNDLLRAAVAGSRKVDPAQLRLTASLGQPRRLDTGMQFTAVRPQLAVAEVDGLSLLMPQGPAVDAAVRIGGEMARDREVFRQMTRFTDGRAGLVILLGAIAAPGPLDKNSEAARGPLNREFEEGFQKFAVKVVPIHRASTHTLVDFNPAGSQGRLVNVVTSSPGSWGSGPTLQSSLKIVWSGDSQQIANYDMRRSHGQHGMPSTRLPSNPKAFVPAPIAVNNPSLVVNAVDLARLIGLTEGDRQFLAQTLATARGKVRNVSVTPASFAKEVFSADAFNEVFLSGEIPDREDFKDRFVRAVDAVLKTYDAAPLKIDRQTYASGPNVSPVPGKAEPEIPVVATTACVRCHDVQKPGKAAFSPIPVLAFDPFDKDGREAWAKRTPPAARQPVLARLLKRIHEDKDMPPEDSAEYDTFRVKSPAAFDAMRDWIDAELKRAK